MSTNSGVFAPRIFFSFASEDLPFVSAFAPWFTSQLDNVVVQNYKDGDNLNFGELNQWIDEHINNATAVIAFLSEYYIAKRDTLEEFTKAISEFRRRRLIFVPIILHADAKVWWTDLRRSGNLNALPNDFVYSDFTQGGRSKTIAGNDEVQRKIGEIARAIRRILTTPSAPKRTPADAPSDVIILGHPTSRFADFVAAEADALANSARDRGLSIRVWNDGWFTNAAAREGEGIPRRASSVFVQPLAAGEASEHLADIGRTAKRLSSVGILDPPAVVLWLPNGQTDLEFEKVAVEAPLEAQPELDTLQNTPTLRRGSADTLAAWMHRFLRRTTPNYDAPVVQVQTVGSQPGENPDLDAARLSERLTELFSEIVNSVVPTDASSPWQFWARQFKAQIALLPGSRAIVAVHDLDVTPSADPVIIRKRIELKFQDIQEQAVAAGNLKFFWAALLYKHANALPFGRYPHDARYRNWRLLSFEPIDENVSGPAVRPDPASLGVFRNELSLWATS